jgi:hypothetical protein
MRRRAKRGHEKASVHFPFVEKMLPSCDLPHRENYKRSHQSEEAGYRKKSRHDLSFLLLGARGLRNEDIPISVQSGRVLILEHIT